MYWLHELVVLGSNLTIVDTRTPYLPDRITALCVSRFFTLNGAIFLEYCLSIIIIIIITDIIFLKMSDVFVHKFGFRRSDLRKVEARL